MNRPSRTSAPSLKGTHMDTLVTTAPSSVPATLRKLYFLRFAFAAVWAALLFATADTLGPLGV